MDQEAHRIREAARHWVSAARPGGLLLRSPALEEAERWIASRPRGAPEPTAETQTFVADSRRGATRRRNVLTGSLAAGLLVALALAGLAYWQRGVAVEQQQLANEQRQLAERQRQRAEDTLAAATKTANSLVFDLAQKFKDTVGIPSNLIKEILDRARGLQDQLAKSGELTPDLRYSAASALTKSSSAKRAIGDTTGALADLQQARQIMADAVARDAGNKRWKQSLAVIYENLGQAQAEHGDYQDALASLRDGLATLQTLTVADPDDRFLGHSMSIVYKSLGDIQFRLGNQQDALRAYRDAIAVAERLVKADPNNAEWQYDLAVAQEHVGIIQQN